MSTTKQYIMILGLDEKKQQRRAAKFDIGHAEAVRKAAHLMELSTAIPKTEEQRALLSKVAEGKLFASGKGLVPLVKKPVYDILIAKLELENPPKPETKANEPASQQAKPALPQAWQELKVGTTVIAPDQTNAAENGWWPGVITAIKGDLVVLRWIDVPKQKPATFSKSAVAILPPSSK